METNKRIKIIDQIRGFAMFGVLLVNLTMMESPLHANPIAVTGTLNVFFENAINLLAVGKFYTMFSILFGLGFYLFMEKEGDVIEIERLFKRRLRILLIFGLLHLVFGWSGDILHVYAIAGFFLISKRVMPPQQLLKRSVILFLFSVALVTILTAGSTSTAIPMPTYDDTQYFNVVVNRITHELPYIGINLFFVLPRILSLFYLGYYIGKTGILKNLEAHLPKIKKLFKTLLVAFACLIGLQVFFSEVLFIRLVAVEFSTLIGALLYGTGLILLSTHHTFGKSLSVLNAPGKMALTNYLIQTVFWTTVIYGYGADLGGQIPYALYLPLALTFYGIQIVICNIWMRTFKQGPMESLWRHFTYNSQVKNQ